MQHEKDIAVSGFARRATHRRRAGVNILRPFRAIEHERLHPGLYTHLSCRHSGRFDPDLFPEPPAFFRCPLRSADRVPAGFAACVVNDDCRRTTRYPWNIDLSTNPLGAFLLDWIAGSREGFETEIVSIQSFNCARDQGLFDSLIEID